MKENYFKDPDGNVWVSEDDYRQYQSQMQTVSETVAVTQGERDTHVHAYGTNQNGQPQMVSETVAVTQGESDTHIHAYGVSEEITEEVTQRRI